MRRSVRWLAAAVAGGLVAVAIPLITLDRAFDTFAEREERERLSSQARATLDLAERRLQNAATVLVDLAAAGVDGCGAQALEAMRLAVFTKTPLKGLSILDEQGRTVCNHAGMTSEPYAISREYVLPGERLSLAIARLRDRDERAVRLRFEQSSGRSVAALIAADAFLPDAPYSDAVSGRRTRLVLDNGEVLVARPFGDTGAAPAGRSLVVQRSSERYPIVVIAERSVTAVASNAGNLQFVARFAGILGLVFGILLLWLSVRRKREEPVDALRKAIRSGEIVPFFQPTVDTRNGRVLGAEVLARWRRPDGVLAPPADFIPLAEQSGLIFELTRVLMQRAREEVGAAYRERPNLTLAFNLFAGHFADPKVVRDIQAIFQGSPIATNQVVLEVTEGAPLADLGEARRVIEMLQSLGARVAIDDVGTGHAGLSYLLKLGVNIIKIDKMFIDAINTERNSQTIIETLAELARTMDMDVIAEGVETLEQIEYLRSNGVYAAQGYVFAPPLPASSYLALVEAMERPRLSLVSSSAPATEDRSVSVSGPAPVTRQAVSV